MLNLEISCRGQTTCLYRVVLPHTDLYLAEHDILKEQISERKKKVSAKERKSELKLLSRDRLVKNVFILEGTEVRVVMSTCLKLRGLHQVANYFSSNWFSDIRLKSISTKNHFRKTVYIINICGNKRRIYALLKLNAWRILSVLLFL